MAPLKHHQYDPISPSSFGEKNVDVPYSDQNSEDEPFLETRQPAQLSSLRSSLPWLLCAVFATLSGVFAFLLVQQPSCKVGKGYINDFLDPATIPLEQVRFSGSPQIDLEGHMHHKPWDKNTPWPENVPYFGDPSPEIDENWKKLIGMRYFSISEEEAKSIWPDNYKDYVDQLEGGYTAGLDVFHTLHCVNAVRMELHKDYYNESSRNDLPHIDHCLDAIRQYIQCAGITTLVPTKWREGLRRNYIDSDQVHTCRSFTYLRDFTTSRRWGGPAYVERDRSVLDLRKNELAEKKMKEMEENSWPPS
ncbi:hypothetical protein N431DRAFT_400882 [Stipitochalara longipes BDJ]|nr:hypothetical protein N431DRAFT_400882 [Stipitochalara longipes BDJ]